MKQRELKGVWGIRHLASGIRNDYNTGLFLPAPIPFPLSIDHTMVSHVLAHSTPCVIYRGWHMSGENEKP